MKKLSILSLVMLLTILLSTPSCKKEDIQNIRTDQWYELIFMDGPNRADFKGQLFPGGYSRVLFIYRRDKTVTLKLENTNWDPCNCYWGYYGEWFYNMQLYEYTAAATFDSDNSKLVMDFQVPEQYRNTTFGSILRLLSGTYTAFRTNGTAIGPKEVVEVTGQDVTFKIAKTKI